MVHSMFCIHGFICLGQLQSYSETQHIGTYFSEALMVGFEGFVVLVGTNSISEVCWALNTGPTYNQDEINGIVPDIKIATSNFSYGLGEESEIS